MTEEEGKRRERQERKKETGETTKEKQWEAIDTKDKTTNTIRNTGKNAREEKRRK